MLDTLATLMIDIAAIVAGLGGAACFVYLLSLVLWERHQEHAFLDDYRYANAARRAGYRIGFEPERERSRALRAPAPCTSSPGSIQHHA
jgi:hypothetical protein